MKTTFIRPIAHAMLLAFLCGGLVPTCADAAQVVDAWKGYAKELKAKVVILYARPVAPMTSIDAVSAEAEKMFRQYEKAILTGGHDILIIKMTTATVPEIRAGQLGGAPSWVFVRSKNNTLARVADKDLLSRIIIWEGTLHGQQLRKL